MLASEASEASETWQTAAGMLVWPSFRSALMACLRRVAMFSCPRPVRIFEVPPVKGGAADEVQPVLDSPLRFGETSHSVGIAPLNHQEALLSCIDALAISGKDTEKRRRAKAAES